MGLSRRLLPLPRDARPLPPAENSLLASEAWRSNGRIQVRSEPTLCCSLASQSPSGASSSSESFGSKLLRLFWRLEAGGPRLVGVEGRIIGSLKSLDGRRSGKATCIISSSVIQSTRIATSMFDLNYTSVDVSHHMPFCHLLCRKLICWQMSTQSLIFQCWTM